MDIESAICIRICICVAGADRIAARECAACTSSAVRRGAEGYEYLAVGLSISNLSEDYCKLRAASRGRGGREPPLELGGVGRILAEHPRCTH
jgi:hypothetical protein